MKHKFIFKQFKFLIVVKKIRRYRRNEYNYSTVKKKVYKKKQEKGQEIARKMIGNSKKKDKKQQEK